jgi:hypothetical protein
MKSLKIFIAILSIAIVSSCTEQFKETKNLNFITFQEKEVYFTIDVDETSEIKVLVNTTNKVGNKRTVKLSPKLGEDFTNVNLEDYNIPEYVEIPANSNVGEFTITAKKDINFGPLDKITIEFIETDMFFEGELTVRMREFCDLNPLILNIQFDNHPEETEWSLKGNGQTWMVGKGEINGPSSVVQFSCLADGEYTLEVKDSFFDGFLQGGGTITLSLGYDNEPFLAKVDFDSATFKYVFKIENGVATQL